MTAKELELQSQDSPEQLKSVRQIWFYKVMSYIYEMFFKEKDTYEIYQYKDDTFLLKTVSLATVFIVILFCAKLYSSVKYKRSIQTQIKVVNSRIQKVYVSIEIVRKIIDIHECIIRNQQEVEHLQQKKNHGVQLGGSASEVHSDNVGIQQESGEYLDENVTKHEIVVKENTPNYVQELENIEKGSARKNVKGVEFADKKISDVSIEPVSRKSKTRYTVITVNKSRSQPNIHQSYNDGQIDQSKIGVKRSASDAAISEPFSNDTYNGDDPELAQFDDGGSNHTNMSDFIKYVRNSSAQEDIKSCSNQIMEFLNEFEASIQENGGYGAVIPWEKNVEIKVLFDILVGQIHDHMNDINDELSKF